MKRLTNHLNRRGSVLLILSLGLLLTAMPIQAGKWEYQAAMKAEVLRTNSNITPQISFLTLSNSGLTKAVFPSR